MSIDQAPAGLTREHLRNRREININLLAEHGLDATINDVIAARSWAIVSDGHQPGSAKQALYDRGFGWVDNRLGFWEDTEVVGLDGEPVLLDSESLLVPCVSRDDAADLAHAAGDVTVLFGSCGRFTCVAVHGRDSGTGSGWKAVGEHFQPITPTGRYAIEVGSAKPERRVANRKSRVGKAYQYLFSRRQNGTHPPSPDHYYYSFLAGQKYRVFYGLSRWIVPTPRPVTALAIWLPLTTIGGAIAGQQFLSALARKHFRVLSQYPEGG
jgi:hypothetical protein